MITVDTKWFDQVLRDRRLSRRQLAKRLGVDPSAVSLMFRGMRHMSIDRAAEIAQLLNVPVDELLRRAGSPLPATVPVRTGRGPRMVPVVGHFEGDGEVQLHITGDEIPGPDELPLKTGVLIGRTAAGPMRLMDGWALYVAQHSNVPADIIGRYSVARTKSGLVLLRWVTRSYQQGHYNLLSCFSASVENIELDWASPVIWIKPV